MLNAYASSKIHENEITAAAVLTPEAALKQAAADAQVSTPVSVITSAWPNINDISLRLANRLTHLYPAKDGNLGLLALCLADAAAAYREAGENSNRPRMMAVAYIQTLLETAADFTRFDVHAVNEMGEGERWDATREPLTTWITSRPGKRIVFSKKEAPSISDRQAAKLMLLGHVLSMKDSQYMPEILASPVRQ